MEAQTAPLRQRLQKIEGQIGEAHIRLVTRIEEIDSRQTQITTQQTQGAPAHTGRYRPISSHRLPRAATRLPRSPASKGARAP